MQWSEVEGCLKRIADLTSCSPKVAEEVFLLVADWTGGNTPDVSREKEKVVSKTTDKSEEPRVTHKALTEGKTLSNVKSLSTGKRPSTPPPGMGKSIGNKEREMIREMYGAYLVQCNFLNRLAEIHEDWAASKKRSRDFKRLLDKVHEACQLWRQRRVDRGVEERR